MRHTRTYTEIHAVIQRNPSGTNWYAGYGARGREGTAVFSMGCFLEETHDTKNAAKTAAYEMARSYRNTVLTLGGCTFETLPPIKRMKVGI
jgi:hypothetical protein